MRKNINNNSNFEYWENINKFDSYLTAKDALKVGIIDEIIGG